MLADVSNNAVRELVEKMSEAGRSAKTIRNYVQVVKPVVASAVDEEGEQLHPRKWNHDFIQLPVVRKAPTAEADGHKCRSEGNPLHRVS